ncbi:hypothetical protein P1X14_12585 [Sphingomonas sp. AOB5]|uniref:hypothetical protein n=1 Tax=Sphingomonas sp. AOB5 TaxID=3034017 RepID=UPI0023F6FA14|nr:hypothetical protein [Sphingomonas sp. AOB5]MDF7776088.1 hypothetical protein [Sphingomonas sp. AOB5]
MKIYDKTKKELMQVSKIERDGNALVLKGKIFGTMPMTALLTPEEARAALKLLDVKTVFFLLTILFRKSSKGK